MSGKIGFTFRCAECGAEQVRTLINQKLCLDCRANQRTKSQYEHNKSYRERWYSKPEAEKSAKPTYTLAEVSAAARKHNMTYGNYVYQLKIGAVEPPEKTPEQPKKKRGRPCKST